jgi:hypothetical protein
MIELFLQYLLISNTTVPSTVVPRQNSRFLLKPIPTVDPNEKLGGRIGILTSRRGILWEQY